MIADLWQDLRFALRSLRLRPGFSAMVVLTLGLGVAANIAIFGLVNAALLRPLPVRAPEELVLFGPGTMFGRRLASTLPARDGRAELTLGDSGKGRSAVRVCLRVSICGATEKRRRA